MGKPWTGDAATITEPRFRIILDNDFSGDPDGMFALAHLLLSPSIAMPLIVGSHLHADDWWDNSANQAATGAAKAGELLGLMGRSGFSRVIPGATKAIATRTDWRPSPATSAIISEAMRDEATPLFYAAGAGLTELALAVLTEPRIGRRLKLIWIGGNEHPLIAYPPPGKREPEYNLTIDLLAAQIIFNESDVEIWQVPRNAYRQMLFSFAELDELAATGPLGRYLKSQIDRVLARAAAAPIEHRQPFGETYILGDSPLVTLSALQAPFQPDPSSSVFKQVPTPLLNNRGEYRPRAGGRPMRAYTAIDTRLTFRDMVSKVKAWDADHKTPA